MKFFITALVLTSGLNLYASEVIELRGKGWSSHTTKRACTRAANDLERQFVNLEQEESCEVEVLDTRTKRHFPGKRKKCLIVANVICE